MTTYLFIAILFFGTLSYALGVLQMLRDEYAPSTFSRVIWLLLAVNSFLGVVLSGGSDASILLGVIFLVGNALMCLVSFWKGTNEFGYTEKIALMLLLLSVVVWIFYSAPLINLFISLFAHFIGGIPTYKKVIVEPRSESSSFWSLFFLASLLSIFASDSDSLSSIVFPTYFTLFDGAMFLLSLRKR